MRKAVLYGGGFLLVLAGALYLTLQLWLRADGLKNTLEAQASAGVGVPVRIARVDASVFPRLSVDLVGVTVGEPPRARFDRVSIVMGLAALWSRRIEDADVRLIGGELDPAWLGGLLGAAASVQPPPANARSQTTPLTVDSIRSLRFRDVGLIVANERFPLNLDASFGQDRLVLGGADVRIRDATVSISGEMSSLARREGHFEVKADVFPVSELLGALSAAVPAQASGTPQPSTSRFRITANIAAPAAIIGGRRVDAFASTLEATPSAVVLNPVTFTLDNGRFEMRIASDTFDRDALIQASGRVSGLDVARLQSPSSAGAKTLTGRLDATFALRAPPLADVHAMTAGARGSLDLAILDGRMPGIAIVRETVLRFANRAGPPPRMDGSDAFSRLDASLALQSGTSRITRLAVRAADFDLEGEGTLSPRDWRIAIAATVALSEELSQQAGRDLYRYARDGKRITLPVILGGTLFEPTATIDVSRAAERAIKNRIEEEVQSIFDRLIKKR